VSILEAAVNNRKIAHSPAVKIRLPTINKNVADSITALGLDDVRRIADAAPPWMTTFVWTVATDQAKPPGPPWNTSTSCAERSTSTANSPPSRAMSTKRPKAKLAPPQSSRTVALIDRVLVRDRLRAVRSLVQMTSASSSNASAIRR
jgi:hypothetical protein